MDAVIHLAAIPGPTGHEPERVFSTNTDATFTVLWAAAQAGVGVIAAASSINATGLPFTPRSDARPAYLPYDVALPTHAADPYSLSKVVDEQTAAAINRRFGTTVVMLRLPFVGVADPDDPQSMARRIDSCAREPERWVRELWSCLDVRDAARAMRLALSPVDDGAHTMFVAAHETAAPYPTEELLDHFLPGVPRRQSFPARTVPIDLRPATDILGFEARYPPLVADVPWRDGQQAGWS